MHGRYVMNVFLFSCLFASGPAEDAVDGEHDHYAKVTDDGAHNYDDCLDRCRRIIRQGGYVIN